MSKSNDDNSPRSPRYHTLLVVALLAVHAGLAMWSMRSKNATWDEVAHVTAGYSFWATDDYRLVPAMLAQRWAALPLMFGDDVPPKLDGPNWWLSHPWRIGFHWFYESGNDVDSILFRARSMIVLASMALGFCVFQWSKRLFGIAGGLLSLFCYAFSPTMLAHGRLVTADLFTAFGYLVAVGSVWLLLHRVSWVTWLVSSSAIAAVLLAKPSGAGVLLIALLLAAIRICAGQPWEVRIGGVKSINGRLRHCGILASTAFVVAVTVGGIIWICYGLRYDAMKSAVAGGDTLYWSWDELLKRDGAVQRCVGFARQHQLLPEAFLFQFAQIGMKTQGRAAFMNGEYSVHGWRSFFPFVFLVKTPLPVLVAVVLAGLAAAIRWRRTPQRIGPDLYALAPLISLLAVYWLIVITSRFNIGHRHILPVYPPMFVLVGAAAHWLPKRRRANWAVVVLAAVAVGQGVETIRIAPHYLAYFNQTVGGPRRAYRHLVDSSLDWGQDLKGLARWLDENSLADQSRTPVYLSYFGTASPRHYGINAIPLPGNGALKRQVHAQSLRGGVYCISATMLQCVYLDVAPWQQEFESKYVLAREAVQRFLASKAKTPRDTRSDLADGQFKNALLQFDSLRFARLCEFLKQREPDADIGHSILIYRLTDDDVQRALFGPIDSTGIPRR